MRNYSLTVIDKYKENQVELTFDTEAPHKIAIRTYKKIPQKPEESNLFATTVWMEVEDARAIVEFLHSFLEEHNLVEDKLKGA